MKPIKFRTFIFQTYLFSDNISKMLAFFQPFEYQLNVNIQNGSVTKSNKPNIVSILIHQQANLHEEVKNICQIYNLNSELVQILVQAIDQEIQKQIAEKQTQNKRTKKTELKKFKNKFCQYLNQIGKQNQIHVQKHDFNQVQTSKSHQFSLYPSTASHSAAEQYSFRPIYQKILDMADEDQTQEMTQPQLSDQSRISYYSKHKGTSDHSYERLLKNQRSRVNQRKVFDQLYQNSLALRTKKQMTIKKSFQKIPFKPSLNQNSQKIIEMKKQLNPYYQSVWKRSVKQKITNSLQNQLSQSKKQTIKSDCNQQRSKSPLQKSKCQLKIQERKPNPFQQTFTIYQRGQIYRRKSQQKLTKYKENAIQAQMNDCTFKPKIISNPSNKKTNSYGRIRV